MAEHKTIPLAQAIPWHHGEIREVVVRMPTLAEYGQHGDPFRWVKAGKGEPVYIENDTAIAAYLECCVVEPKDRLAFDHVGLADAMKIKGALLDFFFEAKLAVFAPPSPTGSSSTSASSPRARRKR